MSWEPRAAFKAAFIRRCLDRGVDPRTAAARLVVSRLEKGADFFGEMVKSLRGLGQGALTTALIAPPLAGAAAGYSLAKMEGPSGPTPEELQKSEAIDEMRRQALAMRQAAMIRNFHLQKETPALPPTSPLA
jgi:hypothetical protein